MSDQPEMQILRYEAQWGKGAEWQECTKTDYEAIRGSIHPHQFKARVIGIVEDPAGLLMPGPGLKDGSWRDAAVQEKMLRLEAERELKKLRAELETLKEQEDLRVIQYMSMQDSEGHAVHCMDSLQKRLDLIVKIALGGAKENG